MNVTAVIATTARPAERGEQATRPTVGGNQAAAFRDGGNFSRRKLSIGMEAETDVERLHGFLRSRYW
jgi:hypothetical protein